VGQEATPAALHAFRAALRTLSGHVARRLLAGAGLALAFWAFTALSQAHADVLPPHSSAAPRPLIHAKLSPPATTRPGTHALRRTLTDTGTDTDTGIGWRAPRIVRATRKTGEGIVRKPAARLLTTVPATRTRLSGLSRALGLPRVARLPGAPGLPSAADAIDVAPKGAADVVHPRQPSVRDDDPGCRPLEPQPPSPTPSATPAGVRAEKAHLRPAETGAGPVTSPPRMKPTGTIAHAPRRHDVLPGMMTPVPAPVSGSGGSGSGGKTSSGDLPRLSLPASGLWSLAAEPETTISRNIADKPSFSPD
jgi:hypothetical protein